MQITRIEMQRILGRFCAENPDYRAALLRSPRQVIEAQFQTTLPEDLEVEILEEGVKTIYVVVPSQLDASDELSDEDLEAVAGGAKSKGDENCQGAVLGTVVEVNVSLF